MQPPDLPVRPPAKAIPPARDRLQSRLLVWIIAPVLILSAVRPIATALRAGAGASQPSYVLLAFGLSLIFASMASLLRTATLPAAAVGGLICMLLTGASQGRPPSLLCSPFPPLLLLFILTSLATLFRRTKKEVAGTAEARPGRRASQIVANLGVAALCAAIPHWHWHLMTAASSYSAAIAALAEATADTLSSEIGQGIAGPAVLITNLRRVPPGTDGAVSVMGTLAGLIGAAAIIFIAVPALYSTTALLIFVSILLAAIFGLFFDSLLGATLERRGWLGNDLVNFFSTAFSALASYPLMLFALHFLHL